MVVNCEQIWREISNYLEDDIDPNLRAAMEAHFRECEGCRSVLEGTQNVIRLYGDERMIDVPLGFSHRLQRRLEENIQPSRRSFLGWMVAAAAAVVTAGALELASSASSRTPPLRSEHAQPGVGIPPDLLVVVSDNAKTFHVAQCPFIHDRKAVRTVTAREAQQQGYVPCVRCMKQYLKQT
jgi:hypothetical protein